MSQQCCGSHASRGSGSHDVIDAGIEIPQFLLPKVVEYEWMAQAIVAVLV